MRNDRGHFMDLSGIFVFSCDSSSMHCNACNVLVVVVVVVVVVFSILLLKVINE